MLPINPMPLEVLEYHVRKELVTIRMCVSLGHFCKVHLHEHYTVWRKIVLHAFSHLDITVIPHQWTLVSGRVSPKVIWGLQGIMYWLCYCGYALLHSHLLSTLLYTSWISVLIPPPFQSPFNRVCVRVSSHTHLALPPSLPPPQCIAAGSHILNHELESEQLRPFAVQLSKAISRVRVAIKEQCLTNRQVYTQKVGYLYYYWSDINNGLLPVLIPSVIVHVYKNIGYCKRICVGGFCC